MKGAGGGLGRLGEGTASDSRLFPAAISYAMGLAAWEPPKPAFPICPPVQTRDETNAVEKEKGKINKFRYATNIFAILACLFKLSAHWSNKNVDYLFITNRRNVD